jgi:hypothetical protein
MSSALLTHTPIEVPEESPGESSRDDPAIITQDTPHVTAWAYFSQYTVSTCRNTGSRKINPLQASIRLWLLPLHSRITNAINIDKATGTQWISERKADSTTVN